MSLFSDLMTDVAIPAIAEFFGDPATYEVAESGTTATVTAMLSRDFRVVQEIAGAADYQTVIEIPTAELATVGIKPHGKDVITIGAARWIVLGMDRDDGFLTALIVRPGDD